MGVWEYTAVNVIQRGQGDIDKRLQITSLMVLWISRNTSGIFPRYRMIDLASVCRQGRIFFSLRKQPFDVPLNSFQIDVLSALCT